MLKHYAKKGLYNTVLLSVSTIATRVISFFFLPFFLSKLTLEEFGIWDFYQTFYSLGLVLMTSCASTSLTRFYLLYKDDYEKQCQSVGNACAMAIAMGISLLLGVGLALASGFFEYADHSYAVLTIFNIMSYALFSMILVYIRVREWLWINLIFVISQNLIATVITVYGVIWGYGIASFFYANIISTAVYIPFFIILMKRYLFFSLPIAWMQLKVSAPLLLYNILYGFFLNADRIMIRYGIGCEVLGAYSLLWRFGAIFQFFCIALMDASPVVLFNAQKESNGTELIRKLLSYITIALTSAGIYSMIVSYYVIGWWFPEKYHYLMIYTPLFFFPIVLLQSGRFFQSAFVLANNTFLIPIISCVTFAVQAAALWIFVSYGLVGICCANTVAFFTYMILCYGGGNYVYKEKLFYAYDTIRLYGLFSLCTVALQYIFHHHISYKFVGIIGCMWPIGLWLSDSIRPTEKEWFKTYIGNILLSGYQWIVGYRSYKVISGNNITIAEHSYSDAIYHSKVMILGTYPPPLGGVSVHSKRVGEKLIRQNNQVVYFDTICRPRFLIQYIFRLFFNIIRTKPHIVLYHTPYTEHGLWEFFIIVCATRLTRSKLYVIEHDCRYVYQFSDLQKRWFNTSMFSVDKLIFIGNATIQSYIDVHMDATKNYSVESAFLPPNILDKESICIQYPDSLRKFIDTTSPCLLANAAQLRLWEGKDLYGFDMCIDLLERLKNTYPDVGIIFALADIGDHNYFNMLQTKLIEKKLNNNTYWLTGQKELWPLFEKVDLFVRPTCNENFGVSIAESLFFKTPAVASDVCIRPEETVIFTSRNIDDFTDKVESILHSSVIYKSLNFQSPKHLSE